MKEKKYIVWILSIIFSIIIFFIWLSLNPLYIKDIQEKNIGNDFESIWGQIKKEAEKIESMSNTSSDVTAVNSTSVDEDKEQIKEEESFNIFNSTKYNFLIKYPAFFEIKNSNMDSITLYKKDLADIGELSLEVIEKEKFYYYKNEDSSVVTKEIKIGENLYISQRIESDNSKDEFVYVDDHNKNTIIFKKKILDISQEELFAKYFYNIIESLEFITDKNIQ